MPGGMRPDGRCRDRADLGDISDGVGLRLQEHLHHGDAVVGLRLQMLDVIDRGGQAALHRAGQTVLHVLRRKSRVIQDHA